MGCECCEQKIYGGGEQGEQDRRAQVLECIEYVNGPDGRLYAAFDANGSGRPGHERASFAAIVRAIRGSWSSCICARDRSRHSSFSEL